MEVVPYFTFQDTGTWSPRHESNTAYFAEDIIMRVAVFIDWGAMSMDRDGMDRDAVKKGQGTLVYKALRVGMLRERVDTDE